MAAPRTATRRAFRGVGALGLLAAAFAAGLVAAAGSAAQRDAAEEERPAASVLDEAATRISTQALRPVDRDRLDAAAIAGMLRAADDQWGRHGAQVAGPRTAVAVHDEPSYAGHVARIVVPTFDRGTGRQVRAAVAQVRDGSAGGIVLDLRGNAGGRLDEAVEVASVFLDAGPVVSYARRDGPPQTLQALADGDTRTPLVVLVDGGTASAGEVVAGALQDRDRAVLVGSRTFGKGSVQEPHRLSDGSWLELTVARYTTPSGRSPEGTGLEPDIVVAGGSASSAAVRRGVEVLGGLLADAGGRP